MKNARGRPKGSYKKKEGQHLRKNVEGDPSPFPKRRDVFTTDETLQNDVKKKRGRPFGSVKKKRGQNLKGRKPSLGLKDRDVFTTDETVQNDVKKKRGRPIGSVKKKRGQNLKGRKPSLGLKDRTSSLEDDGFHTCDSNSADLQQATMSLPSENSTPPQTTIVPDCSDLHQATGSLLSDVSAPPQATIVPDFSDIHQSTMTLTSEVSTSPHNSIIPQCPNFHQATVSLPSKKSNPPKAAIIADCSDLQQLTVSLPGEKSTPPNSAIVPDCSDIHQNTGSLPSEVSTPPQDFISHHCANFHQPTVSLLSEKSTPSKAAIVPDCSDPHQATGSLSSEVSASPQATIVPDISDIHQSTMALPGEVSTPTQDYIAHHCANPLQPTVSLPSEKSTPSKAAIVPDCSDPHQATSSLPSELSVSPQATIVPDCSDLHQTTGFLPSKVSAQPHVIIFPDCIDLHKATVSQPSDIATQPSQAIKLPVLVDPPLGQSTYTDKIPDPIDCEDSTTFFQVNEQTSQRTFEAEDHAEYSVITNTGFHQSDAIREVEESPSPYAMLKEDLPKFMSSDPFQHYHLEKMICITLVRHYKSDFPQTMMTVTILDDFSAVVKVHKVAIDRDHEVYTGMPKFFKTPGQLKLLLDRLELFEICIGNHDKEMQDLVPVGACLSGKENKFSAYRETDFGAQRGTLEYSSTIRSVKCAFFVRRVLRCKMCSKYRGTLRKTLSRQAETANTSKSPQNLLSWKKPESAMSKDELIAKLNDYKVHTKSLEWQLNEKNREIRSLIRQKGTKLGEIESEDFKKLFEEMTPNVEASYRDPTCFQRLFWEEQKKYLSLSHKSGMKWHPMIIKWCLFMKSKSSKAYQAMREAGFLSLPSERTLFDYSHSLPSKTGFQPEVIEHLTKEAAAADMFNKQWKSYVGILQDEMKIKEDLVYDRATGELVGYIDLDKYGNNLLNLERTVKDSSCSVAKYVLVLMVRGITTALKYPLASFSTDGITSDLLYTVLWKAIEIVETTVGLKVLFITCDGASQNRKFFAMNYVGDGDKRVGYWTVNRFAREDRKIFFISDVPHLLKTTRNCFANSGAGSRSRYLSNAGKDISWLHIIKLYEEHIQENLYVHAHKLTHAHIHLTPYTRMKVNLAAQILSNSVANALEMLYGEEVSETVNFIRHMDKFFDCLNSRCCRESLQSRNNNLAEYRTVDDPRLTYLTRDFLGYFDDWKRSLETYPGNLTKDDKARMQLSHQTLNGLNITVNSVVECVRFLLNEGAEFVLTHRFNQDPLEAHFSHYRHKGGRNDNPTLYEVNNTLSALRVVGSQALDPIRGNVKRRVLREHGLCNQPLPKRKK